MGYEFETKGAIALVHPIRPRDPEPGEGLDRFDLVIDGRRVRADLRPGGKTGAWILSVDGVEEPVWIATRGDLHFIHLRGRVHRVHALDALERARRAAAPTTGIEVLHAPMPGVVVEVAVETGALVEPGTLLMMIESMKLQTPIVAPEAARVDEVCLAPGASFDQGAALVRLSRPDAGPDARLDAGPDAGPNARLDAQTDARPGARTPGGGSK